MDTAVTQTTTTPSAPAPAAPPAPTAPAQFAAAPAQAAEGTIMPSSSGGNMSFKETLKSISPTEVIIGVLAVAALVSSIDYFRNNAIANKDFMKSMNSRLDEIDMKMADVSSQFNIKQNSYMSSDGFF